MIAIAMCILPHLPLSLSLSLFLSLSFSSLDIHKTMNNRASACGVPRANKFETNNVNYAQVCLRGRSGGRIIYFWIMDTY